MNSMVPLAKILILVGLVFLTAGGIVYILGRWGFSFGRLPGDIRIQAGNATCVIALGASILLSILLTIILNLAARFLNH